MEWMRQQGFCDWSKTDFKQFLQGLEASGAADIKKLQTFIPSKTEADVKKYSDVFWTRYHELDDESVRNSVAQMAPKLNGFRTEAPAKDYVLDCLDSRLMYQFAIRQALIDLKGMSSITIPYCDALPADGFNEAVDKFILWKITELFCSDEDFYEIIQKQAANLMKSEMTLQEIRARCKQLFAVYSLKQKESSDELESPDYFFQPDLEKLDELKLKRKTLMDSETLVNSSNERNKLKRATQNVSNRNIVVFENCIDFFFRLEGNFV